MNGVANVHVLLRRDHKGLGLMRGGPHRSLVACVLEGLARFDNRYERGNWDSVKTCDGDGGVVVIGVNCSFRCYGGCGLLGLRVSLAKLHCCCNMCRS
jgi:hypothetical protein